MTPAELSVAFVSDAAIQQGADLLPTKRRRVAVRRCRGIGLADMVRNSTVGSTVVDLGTGAVTFDGELLEAEPAESVPLSRLYFL